MNEVGSESPKVAINSRPVIKRSKLVYESSASRPMSPKSLNRKEVMDVINGSDSSLESSKDSFGIKKKLIKKNKFPLFYLSFYFNSRK